MSTARSTPASSRCLRKTLGEWQHSTMKSKAARFFFIAASADGLNISTGWMWMWQSVIKAVLSTSYLVLSGRKTGQYRRRTCLSNHGVARHLPSACDGDHSHIPQCSLVVLENQDNSISVLSAIDQTPSPGRSTLYLFADGSTVRTGSKPLKRRATTRVRSRKEICPNAFRRPISKRIKDRFPLIEAGTRGEWLRQHDRQERQHSDNQHHDSRNNQHAPPHQFPWTAASTARFANTRIISRRYSGVSADVVSGLAARAANSPTTDAACSASSRMGLPLSALPASLMSSGAGFTAVMATRASSTTPFFLMATATPASG